MTISLQHRGFIEHGWNTAFFCRGIACHFMPYLIAFHTKIDAGPWSAVTHDLIVKMPVELDPEGPKIAELVIHALDELMVKNF